MKKVLLISLMLVCSIVINAENDVTKFLGIPVDGSKEEMVKKLKAKGFKINPITEALSGEFNGTDVNIYIDTNSNKVCRIMVSDAISVDERTIQIRFNELCEQFENNPNYLPGNNSKISNDEEIGYNIRVNSKRYNAAFYQKPDGDSLAIAQKVATIVASKFTAEELANSSEEVQQKINEIYTDCFLELLYKKTVWFMIDEFENKFHILMFYDNEYNRANGEDL